MVRIDSILITRTDKTLTLPVATAKKPGSIRGAVNLNFGGSPSEVFVLAFGTDRLTPVKEDRTFLFEGLAEGTYKLKILSISQQYGAVDTGGIRVKSGDTAEIGVIDLPLLKLPKMELRPYYDSLRQVVTLTWSRGPAKITGGYNIYRSGSAGLFYNPLNGSEFIKDTFYVDTALFQDSSYTYGVAMVDSSGKPGPLSMQVTIKTATGVKTVDSIPILYENEGSITAMKMNSKGNYVVHVNREGWKAPFFETYSPDGRQLLSRKMPTDTTASFIYNLDFDSLDNIYFSSDIDGRATLCRIDAAGSIANLLPDSVICQSGRFVVFDTIIVFAQTVDEYSCLLKRLSPATGSMSAWAEGPYEAPGPFFAMKNSLLTVWYSSWLGESAPPKVRVFTKTGAVADSPEFFPPLSFTSDYLRYRILDVTDSLSLVEDTYVNKQGPSSDGCFNGTFCGNRNLVVFDKNDAVRVRCCLPGMGGAFFDAEGTIVCWETRGSIKRLRFR
jgi:hypothetical protein